MRMCKNCKSYEDCYKTLVINNEHIELTHCSNFQDKRTDEERLLKILDKPNNVHIINGNILIFTDNCISTPIIYNKLTEQFKYISNETLILKLDQVERYLEILEQDNE